MIKDYFADIEPSEEKAPPVQPAAPRQASPGSEKSIRNISVPVRRPTTPSAPPRLGNDIRSERVPVMPPMPDMAGSGTSRFSWSPRYIMWVAAGFFVLLLIGISIFFFLSDTTITVTPRSHQITFDNSTQFTAYPQDAATEGSATYTVQTVVIEDSASVPATGTEKAQDKASGSITIFNNYSEKAVRLIKNTRFESPTGLVYRIPTSVDVPGKKGATPGQLSVTVFADQPGESYNIGPVERFTLPGLKSTPDMYSGVYARSTESMSGGFVGDKPAVSQQSLDTARAEIRGRLQERVQSEAAKIASDPSFVFPALTRVAFESLPVTADTGGSARVNERATIQVPVFDKARFASAVAQVMSADASESQVTLRPGANFAVAPASETNELGTAPISYTISGSALLVWDVQAEALAQALAGREQAAFESIVASFSGVDKANAKIAPFWRSSFPKDPKDIKVEVENVAQQ